ncbi:MULTISPECIES: hypothetical protein [Galbibacter]|uniref:Selenophosphate synthetase n=1 Tax=Galbibacter pacificus TaxID=2996052 RepID=A0ABT6FLZ1_9FLAO|nr:hypothetical protein [Galbibacter pacificus]MDG3580803.1 hypothetical protein [Galbibacter pacificus]MDG3584281.1 hypothetical protein [Galbibacter pacificus]
MKNISLLIILFLLLGSCKKETNKNLNPLEKIAYAHGFENWNKVDEIKFTFNVDRDTVHFERSWEWRPKKNEITLIKNGEELDFNRSQILSDQELAADKNFINDVYWLLAPYKLIWDDGIEYKDPILSQAPISKDSLQKVTIVYSSEGGYTPGDAYDFYIDKDNMVKEWVYRENNDPTNCMITTWEDYKDIEGLKIATMHQNENGVFKLYFTNVSVKTSED